jgi:elongation factor Ts
MSTVTIDAKLVAALREKTGAGLLKCREALAATNADMEAAIDLLRAQGAATAAKKGDRAANEGIIAQAILPGAKAGLLLEVNCETDFVAKNESFQAQTAAWAKTLAEDASADLEPSRIEAVTRIGENIKIRRSARLEVSGSGVVAAYIHLGGKIGVLVQVSAGKDATTEAEQFKQLVRDITLHIAAAKPICLRREEVPAELADRERAIFREKAPKDKTPQQIDGIVEGMMRKNFYANVCLLEQGFVKNPEQTITALVADTAKALGDTIPVGHDASREVP